MRVYLVAIAVFLFLAGVGPVSADINRIDIKDPARAAGGLASLYVEIGKGTVDFFKDLFMALDDIPKAVLTDIFGVGQKKG